MTADLLVGLLLVAGLLGYLIFTLVRPERF